MSCDGGATTRFPSARGSRKRGLSSLLRGPQREVVAQQLHDERRVLVRLLVERVELGDRVVEGPLGQRARFLSLLLHLVLEDGEVERESEADGVGGRERTSGIPH